MQLFLSPYEHHKPDRAASSAAEPNSGSAAAAGLSEKNLTKCRLQKAAFGFKRNPIALPRGRYRNLFRQPELLLAVFLLEPLLRALDLNPRKIAHQVFWVTRQIFLVYIYAEVPSPYPP